MGTKQEPLAARIYEFAIQVLLPEHVIERDGDDILAAFSEVYQDLSGRPALRVRYLSRCLFALPKVALLDHLEAHQVVDATPASRAHSNRTNQSETPMNRILQDFQYAIRTLRRSPGYTASAVLLLALGVGAVTSSFTLFDNVLLRALPYPDEHRLVVIEDGSHSGPFWRALQDHSTVDQWGSAWTKQANLTGQGDPLGINVGQVSEDFFSLFGARALDGRLLADDDFATADRVVLGYDFWRETFGADHGIIGQTIALDGEAVTVVGIADQSFTPPEALTGSDVDIWRPFLWTNDEFHDNGYHVLEIAGRLKADRSLEEFTAETQAVVVQLDQDDPKTNYRDREGNLWQAPTAHLRDVTVRGVQVALRLLLGAVALLLLIACSNVAHLSVARGLARTPEMTLRRALGANTTSLIRQLLIESLVVASIGGALGVGIATIAVKAFMVLNPATLPRGAQLSLDLRIVLFAAVISSLTTLLFGLLPALTTVRNLSPGVRSRVSGQDRASGILRNSLVVAEIALSLMLLVGAGVLLRSFSAVSQQDAGIQAEGVWRIPLTPPEGDEPAPYISQMASIKEALQTVPGVDSVAHGLTLPFSFTGGGRCCWSTRTEAKDDPETSIRLGLHPISSDYFSTLGIPVRLGSAWTQAEALATPVPVILQEAAAIEIFGSPEAAIGETFKLSGSMPEAQVVAIADDTRHYGLDRAVSAELYLPIERLPFGMDLADFAVRVTGQEPEGFTRSLREAVWSVAPDLPVPTVRRMTDQIGASTAGRRFESVLFGSFGVVALLLAAAGLYGTLLYTVGQRRREMGIRLALGADRGAVEKHVLKSGALVTILGILLGLAGAWATITFLESRIWGIEARDTASLAGATGLLLLTAMLACWLPARKAGRTDPVEALRAE